MTTPEDEVNLNIFFSSGLNEQRIFRVQERSDMVEIIRDSIDIDGKIPQANVFYTPNGGKSQQIAVLSIENPETRADGYPLIPTNRASRRGGRLDLAFTSRGIGKDIPLGVGNGHLQPTQPPEFIQIKRIA